jgi:exodeoxyribonuclease VII large subunit
VSRDEPLSLDLFGEEPPARAPAAEPAPEVDPEPASGGASELEAPSGGATAAASRDEPDVWTVSQVNRAVRNLLESQLPPLWVSGEVANWKRAGSGHCYFTLKDENAQLRCVMWRSDAQRLPIDPDDGMEIRAFGALTLYEVRGEYQLAVRRIEAAGEEGLWRLAFEKLRTRLEAEGLLDPARKRPLPRFPRTVGVVTSTTGAALRDILSVLRRRAPWTRVLVHGTRVQGEGAALDVAHAIRTLAGSGRVDLLIVGRGGGSIEDLWAFNEEPVARAIAACPVPVISAVGHEVDVTISDLVADVRAPTPSAAAEAAVQDGQALTEALGRVVPRLERALWNAVERRRKAVLDGVPRLRRALRVLVDPRRRRAEVGREALVRAFGRLVERRRRQGDVEARLARAIKVALATRASRLSGLAGRLQALSPLSTLERGYAVPLTHEGRVLRGVDDFTPGRRFLLRVVDGSVECEAGQILNDDETRV